MIFDIEYCIGHKVSADQEGLGVFGLRFYFYILNAVDREIAIDRLLTLDLFGDGCFKALETSERVLDFLFVLAYFCEVETFPEKHLVGHQFLPKGLVEYGSSLFSFHFLENWTLKRIVVIVINMLIFMFCFFLIDQDRFDIIWGICMSFFRGDFTWPSTFLHFNWNDLSWGKLWSWKDLCSYLNFISNCV